MSDESMTGRTLPAEANSVIWRILGTWAFPWNRVSPYDLIERMLDDVSAAGREQIMDELHSWFESTGGKAWLRADVAEFASVFIVAGIGDQRSTPATWAIGSIGSPVMARVLRSRWSGERIDGFVHDALTQLERLCMRDEVMDVSRCTRFTSSSALDPRNTKIPKDALVRDGRLETFREIDGHHFELVHSGLYPAVGNLIDLVVDLRPEQLKPLMERLDHPVMQGRAADRVMATTRRVDHRASLHWISRDSCDALVALAIVHTLNTVNALDQDIRSVDGIYEVHWSTELRGPQDDLNKAAAGLISGVVDRLSALEPSACAGWIGELLSGAPYMLDHDREREIPCRAEQLENECTALLARLVRESWSEELLVSLQGGLRRTPRETWTRHMADVAWELLDSSHDRATEIARATLDEHKRYIAKALESNHLYIHWDDWHTRQWAHGLGVALALSQDELNLTKWVAERCEALPLSGWDAEDNHEAFSTAQQVAQHWFLVALLAIEPRMKVGRTVDPTEVRTLAEWLFTHCQFAMRHVRNYPERTETVEYAARCVVEYGEPSDVWLMKQARNPGVGPRALWALIDQRIRKNRRERQLIDTDGDILASEYLRLVSKRFRDGDQDDLESLQYWGHLWLLLEATNEAELTANKLMTVLQRRHDHGYGIIVLKLLALVNTERPLSPDGQAYFAARYRQLWPGHTPRAERNHRKEIDDLLKRSASQVL